MIRRLLFPLMFFFLLAFVARGETAGPLDAASRLNLAVHDLAEQLLRYGDLRPEGFRVGVMTFVDLNHLDWTTPFGRLLAEMLLGELQRAGFTVFEVRLTKDIFLRKSEGEFSLARISALVSPEMRLNAVLIGTYLVRGDYVFVNARLVSKRDQRVLSSALRIMRIEPLLAALLKPSGPPPDPPVKIRIVAEDPGEWGGKR